MLLVDDEESIRKLVGKELARAGYAVDVCIGTTTSGRPLPELEGLIGFFINLLPLLNLPLGGTYQLFESPFGRFLSAQVPMLLAFSWGGTQFDWASGRFDPKDIADAPDVDARRRELGLLPLADYACLMNRALSGATR